MPAAAQKAAGGKMRPEFLGRAARFEIAVAIGKTDHAVGVGDVKILRVGSGRIKRDTEGFVQVALGEELG